MVVTRGGAAGVCVASHVKEELRLALVHAPIPHQHTVDMAAGDWEELQKYKDVTHINAQVTFRFVFHFSFCCV